MDILNINCDQSKYVKKILGTSRRKKYLLSDKDLRGSTQKCKTDFFGSKISKLMAESIKIGARTYWRDLRALQHMYGNNTTQKSTHTYVYRLTHIKGQWTPYYIACSSSAEITKLIETDPEQNKYFGEVVQHGNL